MRSTVIPRIVALVGLLAMVVVFGLQIQALTWESGDRTLHLSYLNIGIGVVTTVAAALWVGWSRRRAGAIVVLVISILMNPIWLLLVIRALG
jgi:hypothetical protein